MQSRRGYLASMSLGVAGLAGCLFGTDEPSGGTADDTTTTDDRTDRTTEPSGSTDEPTTDDPTTTDTRVTVTDPIVRKAVTYYRWPASTRILAPANEQFVVATVEGPEETDPPGFALEADGEVFSPGVAVDSGYGAEFAGRGGGSVVENDHAAGYLAFRVPSPLDADDARIVRDDDGPMTPLPDAAMATLARPGPEFERDALDVPASVERPTPVDVTLTVTNVADVDGRFLAGVHWPTEGIADDDETTVLERDVAAGETTSFSLSLQTGHAVGETSEHPLTVEGSVSADRTVEVIVDETTTAGALGH